MILAPAGDDQSTSRVSVPARRSRTRSCECSVPYLMSKGSSSTSSRMILPLVTLMTVCPAVRKAVACLRVRQRPDLVHRVQVAAGQPVRVALIKVAAQPDVPVRQGEDRLALRQQVQVESLLDEPPGLRPVRRLLDHRAPWPGCPSWSRSSARSLHHDVGPVLPELLRLADPVHADHEREVTRPARLDAGQRVLEHRRAAGRHVERLGRGQERVRRGLAAQAALLGDHPVHPHVEQSGNAGGIEHLLGIRAGRHDGGDIPLARTAWM